MFLTSCISLDMVLTSSFIAQNFFLSLFFLYYIDINHFIKMIPQHFLFKITFMVNAQNIKVVHIKGAPCYVLICLHFVMVKSA